MTRKVTARLPTAKCRRGRQLRLRLESDQQWRPTVQNQPCTTMTRIPLHRHFATRTRHGTTALSTYSRLCQRHRRCCRWIPPLQVVLITTTVLTRPNNKLWTGCWMTFGYVAILTAMLSCYKGLCWCCCIIPPVVLFGRDARKTTRNVAWLPLVRVSTRHGFWIDP